MLAGSKTVFYSVQIKKLVELIDFWGMGYHLIGHAKKIKHA